MIDHVTGLTWRKSGSKNYMTFKEIDAYIKKMNVDMYGGYNDWRLPTLEEAMSIMESKRNDNGLFIDPLFDPIQRWIWTVDKEGPTMVWVVEFNNGVCKPHSIDKYNSVRAVR